MAEEVRIAVIDDHPLLRDGVVITLKSAPELEVVGIGASANDAIKIAQQELPDLILLDIHMPGGGIEALRVISRSCPVVKCVMLTVSEDADDVVAALEAGARGYVLKGVSGPDLVRHLLAVHGGDSFVTPTLAARILSRMRQIAAPQEGPERNGMSDLTVREEQVLILLSGGATNKEIARKMSLSEKTVKHYVTNIMQKLHVRNRVEAAIAAKRTQEVRRGPAK